MRFISRTSSNITWVCTQMNVPFTFFFLVFCLYILNRSCFVLRNFIKIEIKLLLRSRLKNESIYIMYIMYIGSGFWSCTQINFILKLNWLNPAADLNVRVFIHIYIHVSMYMKICNTRVMDCINLSIYWIMNRTRYINTKMVRSSK